MCRWANERGDIFEVNSEEEAIEEEHFPVAANPGSVYQMAVDDSSETSDTSKGEV
jgi:hypothetical protein